LRFIRPSDACARRLGAKPREIHLHSTEGPLGNPCRGPPCVLVLGGVKVREPATVSGIHRSSATRTSHWAGGSLDFWWQRPRALLFSRQIFLSSLRKGWGGGADVTGSVRVKKVLTGTDTVSKGRDFEETRGEKYVIGLASGNDGKRGGGGCRKRGFHSSKKPVQGILSEEQS